MYWLFVVLLNKFDNVSWRTEGRDWIPIGKSAIGKSGEKSVTDNTSDVLIYKQNSEIDKYVTSWHVTLHYSVCECIMTETRVSRWSLLMILTAHFYSTEFSACNDTSTPKTFLREPRWNFTVPKQWLVGRFALSYVCRNGVEFQCKNGGYVTVAFDHTSD
jgi:hypothetical protein